MPRPPLLLLALTLAGIALLSGGCGPSGYDELRGRLPRMPDRWIEALAAEDAGQLEKLVEASGVDYLVYAESELSAAIRLESLDEFQDSIEILHRPLTRVRLLMRDRFGFERNFELHEEFFALPPEEALSMRRLWRRAHQADRDETLSHDERALRMRRVATRIDSLAYPQRTAHIWLRIRMHEHLSDRDEAAIAALRRSIEVAEEDGDFGVLCQSLGVLGSYALRDGDIDGMRRHWESGLAVATRHRLASQSGRLLLFFANYHASQGQLDLARRLMAESEQTVARFGGSPNQLRFLVEYLDFNARMGCWDVVEQGLPRAPGLVDRIADWRENPVHALALEVRLDLIRARLAAATGDVRTADEFYERALARSAGLEGRGFPDVSRLAWGRSLVGRQSSAEALDVLGPCLDSPDSLRILPEARTLVAQAHAQLGEWERAVSHVRGFEELGTSSWRESFKESVNAQIVLAKASLARGDQPEALAIIAATCDSLESELTGREASQESYLLLRHLNPFHEMLHELVEPWPELALELEQAWQEVPTLLGQGTFNGRGASPLQVCKDIVTRSQADGPPRLRRTRVEESELSPDGDVEIVYWLDVDSLERWTLVGDQYAYDVTAVDPDRFRQQVSQTLADLGREVAPGASLDDGLRAELHELALLLLPAPVLEGGTQPNGEFRRLRLKPGTVVTGFPFGVLNLNGDGYTPLVSRFDLVYERGQGPATPTESVTGPDLIIADPRVGSRVVAWESGLPPLPHGIREARALHEMREGSILLEREAATGDAIRRHWDRSGLIYFASHVVQDPSSPYLSYIPLAESPPGPGQARVAAGEYLNIRDIRAAPLRGRPLVVLSACSSGAPYQTRGSLAPSLGDAFLDAGASTVIHNLWSVRDDAAAELMQATMRAWIEDGIQPDRALNDARRAFAAGDAFAHPYFWGSAVAQVRGH